MEPLHEAEIQALIALAELADPVETPNNIGYSFYPKTLEQAASYFRRFALDWTDAFNSLQARGLVAPREDHPALTQAGLAEARRLRLARPPIYYWYRDFYTAAAASQANFELTQRIYGRYLCQQGFMDMEQLHRLVEVTGLQAASRFLDLGCGNGMIAEYISDLTGACGWGVDYIPEAIEQARERCRGKRDRLDFRTGNLDSLDYPPGSFDVLLAADTLYMPNDLDATLRDMRALLVPGGRMGIYYSFDLWDDPAPAPDRLRPENTPLGQALRRAKLPFRAWDYTAQDYRHALLKKEVAEELRPAFEAEGNRFLFEVRAGEAAGVAEAVERGIHARYLYRVEAP